MTVWRIPRSLLFVALAIMGLHVLTVVFFGDSLLGSLFGNALQISASFLAATLCFRAARKVPGFTNSFWTLVGFGMAMWGVADIGWTYYEVILHIEPPPGSFIQFIFDTYVMFFVMAVFLDKEKKDSNIGLAEALDFIQVGILFFFIYFGMYYLPALSLGYKGALAREIKVVSGGEFGVFVLVVLHWRRARLREVRRLLGGLALYLLIYAIFAAGAEIRQVLQESRTGTWLDLAWTIPLLYGAFWAAFWQPVEGEDSNGALRRNTLFEILSNNILFFLTPLVILFQVAQLGPGWRLIRFGLLGLSLACYALRVGLTQYRQEQGKETVRRQTMAMDSSADGISIINEKGIHIYANNSFARMFGFAGPEQVVGQPWRTVYALQEPRTLELEVQRSLEQTRQWSRTLPLRRPDGRRLRVEIVIAAMPDGYTVCACRDMSQREEAEQAREEAETKYRMLIEQVNAISYIAEIGIDGQWFYVSPQVEAILGYTPEEWLAISRNWADHVHPDDLPVVIAAEKASENGMPFQAEFRIKRKDGREVWLSDTAVVVHGSGSHPLMEGIIVDITERKLLETQLQQARKMEAVGRLAGGIAHDFNNLLTIITGYTDLALSRPSVPLEVRGDIEHIESASGRAAALVRQLLAFSRKQVLQPKTLDLNSLVTNLDKLLRRLVDEHIEMITRVNDDIGKVKADPAQIEQVIMNLVVNARDSMPRGGQLVLEASNADLDASYAAEHASVKPGHYVMLAVSDTGVGMSQETLAHIFEPFYTTKESAKGTGLGLSTVYGIVKQSGGYIWVYSELGKGSTFKVYLPRVEEAPEELAEAQPQLQTARGSETILLVEDEEGVRDLIRSILVDRGYVVLHAEDPKQAEKIAATHQSEIHLLLTDVVMPGTSGRELATRVAKLRPGIRVLYMSGYTENVITSGGTLEKGLAFLQKPFSPSVLVQKVHEVLSRTPAN